MRNRRTVGKLKTREKGFMLNKCWRFTRQLALRIVVQLLGESNIISRIAEKPIGLQTLLISILAIWTPMREANPSVSSTGSAVREFKCRSLKNLIVLSEWTDSSDLKRWKMQTVSIFLSIEEADSKIVKKVNDVSRTAVRKTKQWNTWDWLFRTLIAE